MFKTLLRQLAWSSIPVVGIMLLSGCTNMGYRDDVNYVDNNSSYLYHASNGREYYQDNSGRYYFQGRDGNYYYKVFHKVYRHGRVHYYYQTFPDTNGMHITNSPLSVRVRSYLMADPLLRDQMITVKTGRHGVVRLFGYVNSGDQMQRAVEITRHVPGVTVVKSHLMVDKSGW